MTKEISAVQIDEILDNMHNYQKNNFGMKNGEDFPFIVKALISSNKFRSIVTSISMIGVLSSLLIPKDINALSDSEKLKVLENMPIKEQMADIFYAGYKLGLAVAEINKLNDLK